MYNLWCTCSTVKAIAFHMLCYLLCTSGALEKEEVHALAPLFLYTPFAMLSHSQSEYERLAKLNDRCKVDAQPLGLPDAQCTFFYTPMVLHGRCTSSAAQQRCGEQVASLMHMMRCTWFGGVLHTLFANQEWSPWLCTLVYLRYQSAYRSYSKCMRLRNKMVRRCQAK